MSDGSFGALRWTGIRAQVDTNLDSDQDTFLRQIMR
jgi:hypothetical protein